MELHLNSLTREAWEKLADQGNALLQQRWDYGAAAQSHKRNVARIVIQSGTKPVALAQILQRPVLGIGPSLCFCGPVWLGTPSLETKAEVLKRLTRKHPFTGPLIVMPTDTDALAGTGLTKITTASTLALLTLEQDEKVMRQAMRGKWRNRLVAANATRTQIREERGTTQRIAQLLYRENRQRADGRYKGLPLAFVGTLALERPAKMRLFSAYHDGTECAQMLHFQHGTSATYLIGWSDRTGRALSAHNLLMWHAMRAFARRGVRQLDLGTLDTEAAPGLARFKLGTGAKPTELGGAWAKILPDFRPTPQILSTPTRLRQ